MGDWLGTGTIAPRLREYRPFLEARTFARQLNLKSSNQWIAFCKGAMSQLGNRPADIPTNPNRIYADEGWAGMGDWLGTGTVAASQRIFRSFDEARAFVRKLKLKNQNEWVAYCKGEMPHLGQRPMDIPQKPARTYADKGWKGMSDWLGKGKRQSEGGRKRERIASS